jgi:hypothetical protein
LKEFRQMRNKITKERNFDTKKSLQISKTIDKKNMNMTIVKKKRKAIQKIIHTEYKPYSLREYKSTLDSASIKLGGLGANKDDLWERAMGNLQKMKYFGDETRIKNLVDFNNKPKTNTDQKDKLNTLNNPRSRALEFAKNIRR